MYLIWCINQITVKFAESAVPDNLYLLAEVPKRNACKTEGVA